MSFISSYINLKKGGKTPKNLVMDFSRKTSPIAAVMSDQPLEVKIMNIKFNSDWGPIIEKLCLRSLANVSFGNKSDNKFVVKKNKIYFRHYFINDEIKRKYVISFPKRDDSEILVKEIETGRKEVICYGKNKSSHKDIAFFVTGKRNIR